MKSAVETLSPTRVKLTVEAPFDDLGHALDVTYRDLAQQVRIPGFRPGKVPARLIDQRVGRGFVLEQAVNHAIPELYGQAVRDNSVAVVGQPAVDVATFSDGEQLVFTAEVDVRPEVELPDYRGLSVTVDPATVGDEQLAEQLDGLRDRFATLTGVERAAQTGDFVSLDLDATVGGEPLPDAAAKGMSYEVGSGTLVDGLDEAVVGLSAGESASFTTTLVGGEHTGEEAEVTVTVQSVKEKQLPELDDDFAQTASEFDTLAELREDLRRRLARVRLLEQGVQARDRALDALLDLVDVPLPESLVEAEIGFRRDQLLQQLEQYGMTLDAYLESQNSSAAEYDADLDKAARTAVTSQFVLDAIAAKEEFGIEETELTEHIVRRAQRVGMAPQQFADEIVAANQVGMLVAEVLRGKALALVLEEAEVKDSDGNEVDLSELDAADVEPELAHLHADDEDEDFDDEDDDDDEDDEDEDDAPATP